MNQAGGSKVKWYSGLVIFFWLFLATWSRADESVGRLWLNGGWHWALRAEGVSGVADELYDLLGKLNKAVEKDPLHGIVEIENPLMLGHWEKDLGIKWIVFKKPLLDLKPLGKDLQTVQVAFRGEVSKYLWDVLTWIQGHEEAPVSRIGVEMRSGESFKCFFYPEEWEGLNRYECTLILRKTY